MKSWTTKALELLRASLEPPKHELNELDWKAALSPDKIENRGSRAQPAWHAVDPSPL